ncbi:hypothetical protein D4Q76_00835 [archaeon]|nr:MAG: hypothetical protein D4Q76_00835 [archaeon]
MKIKIISVDLQKDFSAKGGKEFRPRPSVEFIRNTLIPFLRKRNIMSGSQQPNQESYYLLRRFQ